MTGLVLRQRERREWAASPTPGWLIGVEVQEREDRRKAREHRRAPRQLPLSSFLREETLKAMERARELGFTEKQVVYAAPAALLLERFHGKGNVTKRMVREHCERKYPHIFPGECAA